MSHKKLREGDCSWGTFKLVLGWIIDTIHMTIQMPPHSIDQQAEILASIPSTQCCTSVKKWHSTLGELRLIMALAFPGSCHIVSTMQHALAHKNGGQVTLHNGVQNALGDF